MKMKARIKKMWVEALKRTGKDKYTQGKANLRTVNDGYCCLGVLTDLWLERSRPGKNHTWTQDPSCARVYYVRGHGTNNTLSEEVQKWSGLFDPGGGYVTVEEQAGELWQHNDGVFTGLINDRVKRRTFAEIADAIEGQL